MKKTTEGMSRADESLRKKQKMKQPEIKKKVKVIFNGPIYTKVFKIALIMTTDPEVPHGSKACQNLAIE